MVGNVIETPLLDNCPELEAKEFESVPVVEVTLCVAEVRTSLSGFWT